MDVDAAQWSLQVWEGADGWWHWDVRSPGLRSTGERRTWGEAFTAAGTEMTEMYGRGVVCDGV